MKRSVLLASVLLTAALTATACGGKSAGVNIVDLGDISPGAVGEGIGEALEANTETLSGDPYENALAKVQSSDATINLDYNSVDWGKGEFSFGGKTFSLYDNLKTLSDAGFQFNYIDGLSMLSYLDSVEAEVKKDDMVFTIGFRASDDSIIGNDDPSQHEDKLYPYYIKCDTKLSVKAPELAFGKIKIGENIDNIKAEYGEGSEGNIKGSVNDVYSWHTGICNIDVEVNKDGKVVAFKASAVPDDAASYIWNQGSGEQ